MSGVPGGRWGARASAAALLGAALPAAAVVAPAVVAPALAQQPAETGSIAGRVTAPAGDGAVAGARVQALALPIGAVSGVATTGPDGRYRIGGLRPGAYAVVVSRIGYTLRRVDSVRVSAGGTASANVLLGELASTLDQVVVTSSRAPEKILDAPASISVVNTQAIERRPAVTPVDQLRDVPGVDATQGGLAQSNVVARGFNNAFSGALLTLQDYRFASVPSLRVNVPFLVPGTSEDIERIEVLLGPASALYGPNSANGVLHIITKSPFASAGTTATLDGGERSLFRGALRHAQVLSDKVAFKVSGEYFTGRDFEYRDPAEPANFPASSIPARRGQVNNRNFDVRRVATEGRLDWRPTSSVEAITTVGYTKVGNQIELTSANGASNNRNWSFTALQQRLRYKRLFVQAFANLSDAGNNDSLDTRGTYLLRTGQPIVDKSRVFAAQAQHAADFGGDRQRFVYGVDFIGTDPRTFGTTNGRNEGGDRTTEVGGYLQSTTRLASKFDLIAALRADRHSELDETMVSPRVALQYKPTSTQNVRFAYNRAFQTPANFNFFLDLDQARNISGLPYNIRALGVPEGGYQFRRDCAAGVGNLCMRSPFTPAGAGGPGQFVPANAAAYYQAALAVALAGGLRDTLTSRLGAANAAAVINLLQRNVSAANIGSTLRLLNPSNTASPFQPYDAASVRDLPRLRSTLIDNYEVGYKAIVADKFRLSVDAWYQQRKRLLSAANNITPNVFLDPTTLGQAIAGGLAPALGQATATALTPGVAGALARVPVGTVVPNNALTNLGNIYFTYFNIDRTIDVAGSDVALDYLLTRRFTLAGTYSYVNKVEFDDVRVGTAPLALNAAGHKGSVAARWNDEGTGVYADVRGRYTDAYPVNSGVYVGRVPVNAFLDASVSKRFAGVGGRALTLSVNGTNLLDNEVPTFIGVPNIGRLVVSRLQVQF